MGYLLLDHVTARGISTKAEVYRRRKTLLGGGVWQNARWAHIDCAQRQGHYDAVCNVLSKNLGWMAIA